MRVIAQSSPEEKWLRGGAVSRTAIICQRGSLFAPAGMQKLVLRRASLKNEPLLGSCWFVDEPVVLLRHSRMLIVSSRNYEFPPRIVARTWSRKQPVGIDRLSAQYCSPIIKDYEETFWL